MHKYSHHTLEQVRECGLLSPERMAEVEREIEARIEPVFLKSGKEVKNARVLVGADGTGLLYSRIDQSNQSEYIRREALPLVLAPEELEMLNKHAWEGYLNSRDEKDFAKAEKITEWDGGVFVGDTFYASLSDAMEMEDELPAYLWVAEPHQVIVGLNVSDVVENYIVDRGWEDMTIDDLHGVKELQAALDAFVKANEGVNSYREDRSKALILSGPKTA